MIPAEILPCKVRFFRCRNCGLVMIEPRAGVEERDPEENMYWDQRGQTGIYFQEKIQDVFVREFRRRLKDIENIAPGKGTVLDVGCGVGHFLTLARENGWQVMGLDISPSASEAARKAFDLEVKVGTLDEFEFHDTKFDMVTLWDVIEHIRKPLENLKKANQCLKPGGLLVMKTPDEDSFYKWIARAFYKVLGRRGGFLLKYVYYVPHYYSYSRKSMTRLLDQCGFDVVRFENDETPDDFAAEKIRAHYWKHPKRKYLIWMLPIARIIARLLGRSNKLIVYAKKRDENRGQAIFPSLSPVLRVL